MKKLFVLAVIISTLFIATVSHAITIGFDPTDQDVILGNFTDVNIVISDLGDNVAPSLGGFDLNINYNPAILNLSSVVFGNQLDMLGFGSWQEIFNLAPGTIKILELSFDSPEVLVNDQPASFILATLSFNTLAYGTSSLEIPNIILNDESGNLLTASTTSGSINVISASVSEPSTFFLIASGLMGIVWLRRKNFLNFFVQL